MSTWDDSLVTDAILAHKKGITLQMLRALRDRPEALAAGALNAPKIATNNLFGSGIGTIRFASLDTFGGARFVVFGRNTNGNDPAVLQINASDPVGDGTARTVVSVAAGRMFGLSGYWNRLTGAFTIVGSVEGPGTGFRVDNTMTKTGSAVDELIFITGSNSVGIHVMPDGGPSAT